MLIRASCWWFQRFSLYFRVFFVGMGLSSEFAVFTLDHFDFVSFVGFGFSFDGSCAEHLSVESYTIFICQQSYLLLFWYSITTHSFFRGLKPFFLQILPTAALPFSSSILTTRISCTVYCYF